MLQYLMEDIGLDSNQTTQFQKGRTRTDKWVSHEAQARNAKFWTEVGGAEL